MSTVLGVYFWHFDLGGNQHQIFLDRRRCIVLAVAWINIVSPNMIISRSSSPRRSDRNSIEMAGLRDLLWKMTIRTSHVHVEWRQWHTWSRHRGFVPCFASPGPGSTYDLSELIVSFSPEKSGAVVNGQREYNSGCSAAKEGVHADCLSSDAIIVPVRRYEGFAS